VWSLLIILLVLALVCGGLGYDRFGYYGWSPVGVLLVVVLVLWLTGRLGR